MRRLSALDAAVLALSTPTAPLTVASVVVLDGPVPSADEIRDHLRLRTRAVPELRCRVVRAPGDIVRPLWRDDPFDDPGQHLVVADPAASGRSLEDVVASTMEREVDLARPPWEAHLVSGLEHGRWALVLAAHHVLADGAAGTFLLRALLDGGVPVGPPAAAGPGPRRPLALALRTVVRPELPPMPIAGPLGQRRIWRSWSITSDELVTAAHKRGCTVNDLFLAVLAGAFRTYRSAHGGPAAPVRVLVPVSTRRGRLGVGNLDAGLFVNLPVTTADPGERLRSVVRQTRAAKAAGVPRATESLLRAMAGTPYLALSRVARRYADGRQRRVAGAAACVRGPAGDLELLGRKVLRVAPVMPVALEARTSAALLTCAGAATIGITADAAAIGDLDVLLDAVAHSWGELREL